MGENGVGEKWCLKLGLIPRKEMNSKIMIWYAIALNIRKKILKKIIWITAAQRFLKELYSKRRLDNVTVLRKILKEADVWLMSARWWRELQRKMPYNRVRGSQVGCIPCTTNNENVPSALQFDVNCHIVLPVRSQRI